MAGRRSLRASLARALHRMTDPAAGAEWTPRAVGPFAKLVFQLPSSDEPPLLRRRGADETSTDLSERQRDLAFDMYGEALIRIAAEDEERHRRTRRETA